MSALLLLTAILPSSTTIQSLPASHTNSISQRVPVWLRHVLSLQATDKNKHHVRGVWDCGSPAQLCLRKTRLCS